MSSWLNIDVGSPTLAELPYGVFSTGGNRHLCVAVGNSVFDLHRAANVGLFKEIVHHDVLMQGSLNPLLELGPAEWESVAAGIAELLSSDAARPRIEPLLLDRDSVQLHMPWQVADFVDFYASRQHAENVGRLFRPAAAPLFPNWLQLPVGYHGRSGSVVVSGTVIRRPSGILSDDGSVSFGPSAALDMEAELGFVLGHPTTGGYPVGISDAPRHIFGVVVVNDWSARDIQSFEYQPLGPFLGKSFATSVSAWVLPIKALEAARVPPPTPETPPLPHLREPGDWALDIALDTWVRRGEAVPQRISTVHARHLYWTVTQQIAHLTSNGASIRAGDLIATGTISDDDSAMGSLLEITKNGTEPIAIGGRESGYLEDDDEVVITASAHVGGRSVKLGEVRGRIAP